MAIKLTQGMGLFGKSKGLVAKTPEPKTQTAKPAAPIATPAGVTHHTPSVKLMIHAAAAGWEEPRPHSTIHASELLKEDEFCPREYALLELTNRTRKASFVGTALRLTFDHGKALEHRIRNVYLRDRAFGNWACRCGHVTETPQMAPVCDCPECGANAWEYEEVRFKCPFTKASGGVDLLVKGDDGLLHVVEIKSMDKDEFKTLVAPLAEHRARTSMYLRLIDTDGSLAGQVVLSEAHVLYVSKSFGFKDESMKEAGITDAAFSPIKEFVIPRDDSLSQIPLVKAGLVTMFRAKQVGIPGGVCPNPLHRRTAKCSCVTACFGPKYPAEVTWYEGNKPRHENLIPVTVEVM